MFGNLTNHQTIGELPPTHASSGHTWILRGLVQMISFFKQVIFRFQLLIFQGCKHPNPRIHNPSLRLRSPPPRPRSRRTDLGFGIQLGGTGKKSVKKTAGRFYGFDHDAKVVQPPTQDSSHHQDYYIFNKKNPKQQNPSCTTATGRGGRGPHPRGRAPDRILLHRLGLFRLLGDLEIFWKNLRAVDPPQMFAGLKLPGNKKTLR